MPSLLPHHALDKLLIQGGDPLACLTLMDHLPDEVLGSPFFWATRVPTLETLVLEGDPVLAQRLWPRLDRLGWMDGVWVDRVAPGQGLPDPTPNLMIRLMTRVPKPDDEHRAFWETCVLQGMEATADRWLPIQSERCLTACMNRGAITVADRLVETGRIRLLDLPLMFAHASADPDLAWHWLTRHVDPSTPGVDGKPIWWLAGIDIPGRGNSAARSWGHQHHPDMFERLEVTEYFHHLAVTRPELLLARVLDRCDWMTVTDDQGIPAVWAAAAHNGEVLGLLPESRVPWSCVNAAGEDLWWALASNPRGFEGMSVLWKHHEPKLPPSGKGWLAVHPPMLDGLTSFPSGFWDNPTHVGLLWAGSSEDLVPLVHHLKTAPWTPAKNHPRILETHLESLASTGRLSELPEPVRQWWALWTLTMTQDEERAQALCAPLALGAPALSALLDPLVFPGPYASWASPGQPDYDRLVARVRRAGAARSSPSFSRSRCRS